MVWRPLFVVPSFSKIAVPKLRATMGAYAETICELNFQPLVYRSIGKIKTSIRWEWKFSYLSHQKSNIFHAQHVLMRSHGWPLIMQLNPRHMFHDDVLGANGVVVVIAPVKDFRDGYLRT